MIAFGPSSIMLDYYGGMAGRYRKRLLRPRETKKGRAKWRSPKILELERLT